MKPKCGNLQINLTYAETKKSTSPDMSTNTTLENFGNELFTFTST